MHGGDRRNLSPAILASNFLVSFLAAVSWRIPTFTNLYPTWKVCSPKQLWRTQNTRHSKFKIDPMGIGLRGTWGSSLTLWAPKVSPEKQSGSTLSFATNPLSQKVYFLRRTRREKGLEDTQSLTTNLSNK